MKKNILLLIFISLVFTTLKSVKEENAKWIGLATGFGVGAVVGVVTYYFPKENRYNSRDRWGNPIYLEKGKGRLLLAAILGLGSGALAGYLAYQNAIYNTPKSKFNRARDIINKTLLEELVSKKFNNVELYVRYALGRFSSNWPLVDARKKLEHIRLELLGARYLLSSACSEVGIDYRYSYIHNDSQELNEIINDFLDRITDRMSILMFHPFYKDQMKIYEKYQKEERRRRERERKHRERRNEKEDDRWERRREKERDREFLHNLTGNRPTNVGINFNMG